MVDGEARSRPVLGIETATPQGSVALCRDEAVLGEFTLFNPRGHSERLLPAVDTLLKMTGFTPADLGAVAVSLGPGSFTGLRVGVAAAKGLAFALGVPLFGVPTLEALASNAPCACGPVCAVIDARRGEVFTAHFEMGAKGPSKVREEAIERPEAVAGGLPRGTLVVGNLPAALDALLSRRGSGAILAPPQLNFPRASVTALRGAVMIAEGRPSAGDGLLPLYLRPFVAETNRERKNLRKRRECKGANA